MPFIPYKQNASNAVPSAVSEDELSANMARLKDFFADKKKNVAWSAQWAKLREWTTNKRSSSKNKDKSIRTDEALV